MLHSDENMYRGLGECINLHLYEHGLLAEFTEEFFRLEILAEGICVLEVSRDREFLARTSTAVTAQALTQLQGVDLEWQPQSDFFSQGEGGGLLIHFDGVEQRLQVLRKADGMPLLQMHDFFEYRNDRLRINRDSDGRDRIFGLGEKTGAMDRNGRNFTMWNRDILSEFGRPEDTDPFDLDHDPYYMSIPTWIRRDSEGRWAGHFIDNHSRSHWHFHDDKNWPRQQVEFEAGVWREYLFTGDSPEKILEQYTALTGSMPLPPLWSLGFHQCRWKKYTQENMLQMASRFRANDIPCDSLWLDIDYMQDYRVFTWNQDILPDVKSLSSHLEIHGFKLITILDPGIKYEHGYEVFDQARKKNALCRTAAGRIYWGQVWPGRTAFPDFFNEQGRAFWVEKVKDFVMDANLAGLWLDMNEPATGNVNCEEMNFRGDDKQLIRHVEGHNEYALQMARASFEGQRAANPGKRPFLLTRAGSAGIQRFSASWMGDNKSCWEHLRLSIPMALGLSLSGQPFVGADAGGFVGHPDGELFLRWMQCAAWMPFFRNHNDNVRDQYVWSYGEGIQDDVRFAIRRRYELMPYFYTCFEQSSRTGSAIMTPLFYHFPKDKCALDIEDQFMLGGDILVAPVLEAHATGRNVYLPEGEWLSWDGSHRYDGGRFYTLSLTVRELPVFVRAGAIIPCLQQAPSSTAKIDWNTCRLRVYLPLHGNASGTCYFDDGITENTSSTTRASFHSDGDELQLGLEGSFLQVNKLKWQAVLLSELGTTVIPISVD